MNRAWFLQGKLPCVKQSSDALAATSLSKGEMGKVDKFRFFTPLLRCSFSCCHMFSNDSSVEKKFFLQRTKKETGYLHTKLLKSLGTNIQGEMGSMLKIVFVHHNTEGKKVKRKNWLFLPLCCFRLRVVNFHKVQSVEPLSSLNLLRHHQLQEAFAWLS